MASRKQQEVLQRIRDAVIEQRYVVTPHAMFELKEDRLDILDLESAILTGAIEQVFENEPRGRRYKIVGHACDLTTRVGVVLRDAGTWLVVTVYQIQE